MKHNRTSIVLAGAAPDTGNHGVTALAQSLILGLADRGVDHVTVFDHGHDINPVAGDTTSATLNTLAFKAGKRVYQGANMHQARLKQLMGLSSPALRAMLAADAVVDVSGGDSFTDLYGPARFDQITLPKLMALDAGVPLILLPQTFGPFQFKRSRRIARHILKGCKLAFARDMASLEYLRELLGSDFDEDRHRLGVDLAFGLPAKEPNSRLKPETVGINVSGLLWNRSDAARSQFGLTCDYRDVLQRLVIAITQNTNAQIHLVPHVTPNGGSESDLTACRALKAQLPTETQQRVSIEEIANTPSKLKGVIEQTEWFTGARMHATIAALSTATPVSNMAYSRKAEGVFDCCGVGAQVHDLRQCTTEQMVERLVADYDYRHQQGALLRSQLPFVKRRWAYQMDAIAAAVKMASQSLEAAHA
ncbi:MAG: polysaccharide pyruvyl transferase family protein [Kordiimonadaceae bacterium]|nr:polysaccharide pyruvyl transferase family protein [Kordiimonadaceae bacterium]MBO6570768.1 polysaccharide pyruvyl transferase family protein [Kordiimonadaceae bacterium]MBO6965449.1 polysaccharide pyruvyl transferase family protein [Kordiimonadaceae bacterium]